MAPHETRVLPFPVKPDPQLSAFPFDSPDVAILHLERELLRLHKLASLMTPRQTLLVQGEWALLARCLDGIEADIKARVTREAKHIGLVA